MKKWTIEATGYVDGKSPEGGNPWQKLEVVDPEVYVSFPSQVMAEVFALTLNDTPGVGETFVREQWGDGYDYCDRFHFKAVEKDWWPDKPEESRISKIEDAAASRFRSQYSRNVSSILEKALAEIAELNTYDIYYFTGALRTMKYAILGQDTQSDFKRFLARLDKDKAFHEHASRKITEKLQTLSLD